MGKEKFGGRCPSTDLVIELDDDVRSKWGVVETPDSHTPVQKDHPLQVFGRSVLEAFDYFCALLFYAGVGVAAGLVLLGIL